MLNIAIIINSDGLYSLINMPHTLYPYYESVDNTVIGQ